MHVQLLLFMIDTLHYLFGLIDIHTQKSYAIVYI